MTAVQRQHERIDNARPTRPDAGCRSTCANRHGEQAHCRAIGRFCQSTLGHRAGNRKLARTGWRGPECLLMSSARSRREGVSLSDDCGPCSARVADHGAQFFVRQLSNQTERKDHVEIDHCRRTGSRLTRYHRRNVGMGRVPARSPVQLSADVRWQADLRLRSVGCERIVRITPFSDRQREVRGEVSPAKQASSWCLSRCASAANN